MESPQLLQLDPALCFCGAELTWSLADAGRGSLARLVDGHSRSGQPDRPV